MHDGDALGVGCMLSVVVRSLVDAKVYGLGTDNNQFPIVSYTICLLKNWHGQSLGCTKTYFSMYAFRFVVRTCSNAVAKFSLDFSCC